MAVHFHKLQIKEVKQETPDCVSIAFQVPDNLMNEFLFEQGQNITIKKAIDGEESVGLIPSVRHLSKTN